MVCARFVTSLSYATFIAGALMLTVAPRAADAQAHPGGHPPARPAVRPVAHPAQPADHPTTPAEQPAAETPVFTPAPGAPEEGPIFTPAPGVPLDVLGPPPGAPGDEVPPGEIGLSRGFRPPPPPFERCAGSWFQDVYAHARSAVVAVDVDGVRSPGFVFQIRRHVVTTFAVVRHGVHFGIVRQDGIRVPATVVAVDPVHDLAILDTRVPLRGVRPLQAGGEVQLEVGDPVVLMGMSDEDEILPDGRGFRAAGAGGRIHTPPGGDIEFDASVHPRNVGGALLTCDGRVLGVARRASATGDVGAASPVGHLLALTNAIGRQRPYVRNWELAAGLHLVWQGGDNLHGLYNGAMLSIGGVYRRWFGLHLRATIQGMSDENSQALVHYSGVLTSVAAVAAVRWNFSHASRMSFGLGVDATLPELTTRTDSLVVDGGPTGCSLGPMNTCPVRLDHSVTSTVNNNVVLPMAELEFQFGPVSVYTSIETDFSQVQGRFGIGIAN